MSELKAFVFRGQVLQLYRKFLRVAKTAPQGARKDLQAQIRLEFEQHAAGSVYARKYLLSNGRDQLKRLEEMLGMQR